ncbi:protein kinase-like domain-containing protein [Artemisia annua]|uniref:Protein kinase-like domain-containing protein n=1 Tax=Artemisia annua TaxID=35608 RepID=A0A2U1L6F6_ARTAN|nr:protein kinase-like domain-containing protein [Artemisia annua]
MEKYEKVEEVARGSGGVVWKAIDKHSGRVVAIKQLMSKCYSAQERMNLREVKSLIKMNDHPNIVKLKEIIHEHEILFLVFEYMEFSLYQRMQQQKKPFSETEIKNMCFQVFHGLAYMHHNGYIHRDLKPANLLVDKDRIKICDLGQAREMNPEQQPFTYEVATLWYRAPEVYLQAPVYNSAVDMWAMGAIIAELFTLKPLFQGDSEADVMHKICSVLGAPTNSTWFRGLELAKNMCYRFPDLPGMRFSELLPNASPELVNLVATLLSWQPSSRPTAIEVLRHPFFHSCYHIPPTARLEESGFTVHNSVPLVFRMALHQEHSKRTTSLKSYESSSEIVHSTEDLSHLLPRNLLDS